MAKKLKVLMIGWELPPFNSGGLGVACYYIAKKLAEEGIDVLFVLPKKLDYQIKDFPIIFASSQIGLTSPAYSTLPTKIAGLEIYAWGVLIEVLNYAQDLVKFAKLDFDLIHCHDWLSILGGIVLKRLTNKPLIFHVHSTEYDRTGGLNPNETIVRIEKAGLQAADKIIAVSGYLKNIIQEKYGIPASKIEVVYNGINPAFYEKVALPPFLQRLKKSGAKIVSFVGRLTLQKGPDYFIDSAKSIKRFFKNVYFFIAGAGDMMNQIIHKAVHYGLGSSLKFAGFLRDWQLKSFYAASDLFIMPSVSDPFGIVALEAMAYGVPTIVSKNSGAAEALINVLKVDFWDVKETVNKAVAVLKYPALASELSQNGKKEVSKMTWLKNANKIIEIYNEIKSGQ